MERHGWAAVGTILAAARIVGATLAVAHYWGPAESVLLLPLHQQPAHGYTLLEGLGEFGMVSQYQDHMAKYAGEHYPHADKA